MSREEAVSHDMYNSPLASRYASEYMLHLFSDDSRYQTWRRLWTALARAQHQLGLPITGEQVSQLEAHITDIDYEETARRERQVRHDVMAHVYAYGKAAPSAAGIIHLGATSCYVTDNADLILYRDGLAYLRTQLLAVLENLAAFAEKYAATPTLGYTHYQPAQPVTVGKRATLWMQDFLADVEELDHLLSTLRFLGCRGTTGTEASFMELFDGDEDKIDEMNRRISMPEGFLCADAVLRLCQNVTAGLRVNEAVVERTLREYLPFLATEDIMMEAVKRGGDRQQLHEIIRRHSMAATARMKEGLPCDLLDRLAGDPAFSLSRKELEALMEPQRYIGRCPQQVRRFLDACAPLLHQAQSSDGNIRI